MNEFSIEGFAAGIQQAMDGAEQRRPAAKQYLADAIAECGPEHIIAALEAAVPDGADIGEMIVHCSPNLTMLYARVPPHFRSGIHDHTVCAVIGQLAGEERSTLYEKTDDGEGLRVTETLSVKAGEVMDLPADAIHHIENPGDEVGSALHIYSGDFSAIADQRSLWSATDHARQSFSFPALMKQSLIAMKHSGNERGIEEIVKAIPSVEPMVRSL